LAGWWTVIRSPALLTRPDNLRPILSDRYVARGNLIDRNGNPLTENAGKAGSLTRFYPYPALSPLLGYSHVFYGQAGLEAILNTFLRGLQPTQPVLIWQNALLFGQHPPGYDIRLSLDLSLQRKADELLAGHMGALVMLNAKTGEILVTASAPHYDSNLLEESWADLLKDDRAPLLNRVSQGSYQPGAGLAPLMLAGTLAQSALTQSALTQSALPPVPKTTMYHLEEHTLTCTFDITSYSWENLLQAGCPGGLAELSSEFSALELFGLFKAGGLYETPAIRLPASPASPAIPVENPIRAAIGQENLTVSPLQMALAAAALSGNGMRPAPRVTIAVHLPDQGWEPLAPLGTPTPLFSRQVVEQASALLAVEGLPLWESVAFAQNTPTQTITWYLGGTLSTWEGAPVVIVLVLEEADAAFAREVGQTVLLEAIQP